uniref:restriction endonuclease subunit S n=1 Tax=Helicobacter japonicus TaxID=425400 RepID=UPI002610CB16
SRVFNNINSDWKECKLSEIAKIYQPQTIASTDLIKDGTYLVYGANGCIGRYNRYNHDTGQIAICCRGASCGTVNFIPAFSWITGNAMVINIQSSMANKTFVYYCLLATDLSYMISGSGQPQIVRQPCLDHKIKLPSEQEQDHIANLFCLLDKCIDNHVTYLELLSRIKSSLLQQLFI